MRIVTAVSFLPVIDTNVVKRKTFECVCQAVGVEVRRILGANLANVAIIDILTLSVVG